MEVASRAVTKRSVYTVTLAAYLAALCALTLRPVAESSHPPPSSGLPFAQLRSLLNQRGLTAYRIVAAGNVVLFVPLGWLIPMVSSRFGSPGPVVMLAAGCSSAIELVQRRIPGRFPSVDDVLLNTLGGLIGAVMFFAPEKAGATSRPGPFR